MQKHPLMLLLFLAGLGDKLIVGNHEKAELATQVTGSLLGANNRSELQEAVINLYEFMKNKISTCNTEKTRVTSKLMTYLSDQEKQISSIEQWKREKNLLVDYMASGWTGKSFPIVNSPPAYDSINVYVRYNTARLGLSPQTQIEKLKPEYGAVINDVLSFGYYLDIPPCSFLPSVRSIFIAVITQAENFEKRQQIRNNFVSYIKDARQKIPPTLIHFGFFMGEPESNTTQTAVEEESDTFGDIVQIHINDYHKNSPLKMAGVLNWVNRNCAKVELVFKMEEEAKITILSMANFVKNWYTSTNTMFGKPGNTIVAREGKRNTTIQEHPWHTYPDYYDGSTYYILHGTTIQPLLAAMQTTPFFHLEDVYVTGICRVKAGIGRINCAQNDRPEVCVA